MRYTIAALAPSEGAINLMRNKLLAMGSPREAVVIRAGKTGISQPQISVSTSDLLVSESYRDALVLAGGKMVSSNEESSAHDAIR